MIPSVNDTKSEDKTSTVENELIAIEAVLAEDFKRLDLKNSDMKEDKIGITDGFEAHLFPCDDLDECHCSAHVQIWVNRHKYPKEEGPHLEVLSLHGLNPKKHSKALKDYAFSQLSEHHANENELLYPLVDSIRSFLSLHNYIGADEDEVVTSGNTKKGEKEGVDEGEGEGEGENAMDNWDEENENNDDWDNVILCDASDTYVPNSSMQESTQVQKKKREKKKQVDSTPSHMLQKKQR